MTTIPDTVQSYERDGLVVPRGCDHLSAAVMNHSHCNEGAGRGFRGACARALLVALSVAASASSTAAPNDVPAEFQGRWVPSKATCDSPVRVVVTADRLTLVNGADSEAIGGIEMAGPGYFAPGYRGIEAVLITESMGQQPVIATFNPGEKKGAAQVAFAAVAPATATATALLKAYNARISKLNLAKRFPLDKVLLKKCPGAGAPPAR